jgi:MFS family permease
MGVYHTEASLFPERIEKKVLQERLIAEPEPDARIPTDVWIIVVGQFVFYGTTTMFLPALYAHAKGENWTNPSMVFAHAVGSAATGTLVASFLLGAFADRYGVKKTYQVALSLCIVSDFALAFTPWSNTFVFAWAILKASSEGLRGAKNQYMAKCSKSRFNFVSNSAMTLGIVGSIVSGIVGGLLLSRFGDEIGFIVIALVAVMCHIVLLVAISTFLPGNVDDSDNLNEGKIEQSKIDQKEWRLFDYDPFIAKVLFQVCVVVVLLQAAVNVTVMTLFQPVMSELFGWTSAMLAALQSGMSTIGFGVTFSSAVLSRNKYLTPPRQTMLGALCFLIAVVLFVVPPLSPQRLVAAQIMSFIAQIIFQCAPLYAKIVSQSSSFQLAILSGAIPIGQSLGSMVAPYFKDMVGTMDVTFLAVALTPALLGNALLFILLWTHNLFDCNFCYGSASRKLDIVAPQV